MEDPERKPTPKVEEGPGGWPGVTPTPTPAPIETDAADTTTTKELNNGPDSATSSDFQDAEDDADSTEFAPVRSGPHRRPTNKREQSENELFKTLSQRWTGGGSNIDRQRTIESLSDGDEEINRLMSRIFGRTRQAQSEEEKTRHVGVVFKNLTVKGLGLGAALQPTTGDIFLGLPRLLSSLGSKKKSAAGGSGGHALRTLIDDFTGCIKPGEMILVLGRPGAGCSTFLKTIANQRAGFEEVTGEVTYGGEDWKTMQKTYRGEILYNPEDDLHYATLKVKDTLSFALSTRTPGKESRIEGETRADYIKTFLQTVSKLFWIEHTMSTKVGNEFVRGVSGGEKKRVSIAEAMITKASTQCWDNSTRGLDASTALEYVQCLRSLTNMAHISTAVALYQAGESLYKAFDKVILIEQGKCCYYGPAEKAAAYFKNLGFDKPDRWTTADFLTSVTDEHQRNIRSGWENRIPRSPADFSEAFRRSDIFKQNQEEIAAFESELREQKQQHERDNVQYKKRNYTISFPNQVMQCTKRQFKVMFGDQQSLGGKWGGIVFQSLIVGSLFYNLPATASGAFTRGGVIFFLLLFNALLALAELTSAFESRPILAKHKSFSFYRPAAYAIAQTVVDVPLVFIQVFLFDVVVYFMVNLQRTASQFFISILILFILTMTMYSFFRAVGALMGSLDAATRITGVAIQVLIVYTGYLIPPRKMHPWFSWLRWVNPVFYGFECLMANEFYNLDLACDVPNTVPQGPNARPEFQSCSLQGSQPGTTTVKGADYIYVAFQYSRSHLWRNFGIICAFFLFFVFLTALGMELQKPNKGGASVTIYKRGQAPATVQKAIESAAPEDEESGKREALADTSSSDDDATNKIARNESVFTWQNVNYKIPFQGGERALLQNVQGYVKPGKLTALMGASGAGKTTLLNTLAQRIRFGVVTGDFLVDGRPLPKAFQRATAFAEQQDVHVPTATVREALRFSAKLRQPPEVPLEEKYEYCERVLDLLEMREIAGATIGTPGNGLNQEQRKRLTIAVELASKPALLMFLDEPTSGLDSAAAFNIVRFLKKLSQAGMNCLVTIHQPSAVLFEYFDSLLLLKSGGRTVYFGDLGKDSRTLLDYLERNGAKKCPPKANPAEYMLDAIGAGNPDYKGQDWGDVWEKSQENETLTREINDLVEKGRNVEVGSQTKDQREYAMPIWTQVTTVVQRAYTSIWRSPDYLLGKFILHIVTGLFNSFTFWHLGNSQIDMQSRLFSVFMTLTISPPLIQQLQPRFLSSRQIYSSREQNSKIYSWFAWVTGAVLIEIPYSLLAGTIYWCCWYFPTFFPRDTYTAASVWLFVMLFELYYVGFGQAIAAFSPNELLASLLVPVFFLFVVSFCGVVVPYAGLITFWRSWMYWLTPFHYLLEGMLALIVDGVPIRCDSNELVYFRHPPGTSCAEYAGPFIKLAGGYVEKLAAEGVSRFPNLTSDNACSYCRYATGNEFAASFNVFPRNVWRDFGIFVAFIVFNFFVVYLCSYLYLEGLGIGKFVTARKNKMAKAKKEKQQQQQEEGQGR